MYIEERLKNMEAELEKLKKYISVSDCVARSHVSRISSLEEKLEKIGKILTEDQ